MNLNYWYYTLSTIAQTLASILGLGVGFSVLRLDRLTKNIADYKARGLNILEIKKNNINDYRVPISLWEIIKDLEEFSNNYESNYRSNSGIDSGIKELMVMYGPIALTRGDLGLVKDTPKYLRSFVEQRDEMISFIKYPGLITGFTIGISIILLSVSGTYTSNCLLFGVVLLALLSGFLIIRAAWKIITAIKDLE